MSAYLSTLLSLHYSNKASAREPHDCKWFLKVSYSAFLYALSHLLTYLAFIQYNITFLYIFYKQNSKYNDSVH